MLRESRRLRRIIGFTVAEGKLRVTRVFLDNGRLVVVIKRPLRYSNLYLITIKNILIYRYYQFPVRLLLEVYPSKVDFNII